MKKIGKLSFLVIVMLLCCPMIICAESHGAGGDDAILAALIVEAFCTIHVSLVVLFPMANVLAPDNAKKMFLKLFMLRICILLIFDFVAPIVMLFVDMFSVFWGLILILILCEIKGQDFSLILNGRLLPTIRNTNTNQATSSDLKCSKCGAILKKTDTKCLECGAFIVTSGGDNESKTIATPSDFNPMYSLPEDKLLEKFIKAELEKAGIKGKNRFLPKPMLRRKIILSAIFDILLFVYISLIFFHFPMYTYALGLLILIIFFILSRRYTLMKYLKKQIKGRPSEKISNIIMSAKESMITDNTKSFLALTFVLAIALPLLIFINPRIMYEKVDDGYAVRFYAFGLTNYKTATIPETYKNEKVVSLRGNAFSNMFWLESVSLPNSIVEIRGQAFKNCKSLTNIKLPDNLQYLGGGAFFGATALKSIELPDSLTYMGGETFFGATSLEYVKLSNQLSEIRGDTFKYCTSLKRITIPDSVTRIGGHAFYNDTLLSEVTFTPNSQLKEIGSSAFRLCDSLERIVLPGNVYVNERAFKESPTEVYSFNGDDEYSDYEYYDADEYSDYDYEYDE